MFYIYHDSIILFLPFHVEKEYTGWKIGSVGFDGIFKDSFVTEADVSSRDMFMYGEPYYNFMSLPRETKISLFLLLFTGKPNVL